MGNAGFISSTVVFHARGFRALGFGVARTMLLLSTRLALTEHSNDLKYVLLLRNRPEP